MSRVAALCAVVATAAAQAPLPLLSWDVDESGAYTLSLDQAAWLSSPPTSPTLCVGGAPQPLAFVETLPAAGADAFGAWTGVATTRATAGGVRVVETLKAYAAAQNILVATASFPDGVDADAGASCGGNANIRTEFPRFDTTAAAAPELGFLSWRGSALDNTATSVGLAALGQNSLDSGPVVAFRPPMPGVPHPVLVWSTLDAHKIVTQVTTSAGGAGVAAPVNALWSASRTDQVACVSASCAHDQVADGAYVTQRVEGWAVDGLPGGATSACMNNATVGVTPLVLAWSEAVVDNWVGALRDVPAGYANMGENGWVLTTQVAGTVPLVVYSRVYNATHTDFAAVASDSGIAWAQANIYVKGATLGYVFTSAPTACVESDVIYSMGLSAAIPSIPVAWDHSVVFVASFGGPTSATYAFGDAIRAYKGTTRLPSVTLTDIGYYTDGALLGVVGRPSSPTVSAIRYLILLTPSLLTRTDGAYYYVWEAFNIPARPWSAEVGLQLVKEDLYAKGIPVAYMQLDDWYASRARFLFYVRAPRLHTTSRHSRTPAGGTRGPSSSVM